MGVRVVFPDMGKDPSVQLIEKTITENGTYDAITDGANGYSKVNVNVEGGGGSSDFTTAKVDVYFISEGEPIVLDYADVNYFIEYPETVVELTHMYNAVFILNNGASETHPLLYKGVGKCDSASGRKGSIYYIMGGPPTVTGDIEFDIETGITIKGDGSITFDLVQDEIA